jgi:hypothetical protein
VHSNADSQVKEQISTAMEMYRLIHSGAAPTTIGAMALCIIGISRFSPKSEQFAIAWRGVDSWSLPGPVGP